MAWGFHGGASTAPGTAGGWYAGPEYEGNKSPAHFSPYIKNEEEIKQDIIRARQKQLYGDGSSGFRQGSIPNITPTSRYDSIINMIRTGNTPIGQFGFNLGGLGPSISYQSPSFMNWGPVNAGLIGNIGQNRGFLGIRGDW